MLVKEAILHNHEVSDSLTLQYLLWEYLWVEKQMIIRIIKMLPLLSSALNLFVKGSLTVSSRLDLTLVQIEQYLSWYLTSHCIMQQSTIELMLILQVSLPGIEWNRLTFKRQVFQE